MNAFSDKKPTNKPYLDTLILSLGSTLLAIVIGSIWNFVFFPGYLFEEMESIFVFLSPALIISIASSGVIYGNENSRKIPLFVLAILCALLAQFSVTLIECIYQSWQKWYIELNFYQIIFLLKKYISLLPEFIIDQEYYVVNHIIAIIGSVIGPCYALGFIKKKKA